MAKNEHKNIVWDMSTKLAREIQVKRDFGMAKDAKMPVTLQLIQLDDYYNNRHYSKDQILTLAATKGWDFIPPVLPDPFILVETGIDPVKPDFTFKGRDNVLDPQRAKERQDIVAFILYDNCIDDMMPENERNISKSKNAFWKVAFDGTIQGPGYTGKITIGNPNPANIFPDPSAYDVDDCEYIIYAYRLHRRQARRTFGKVIDNIKNDNNHSDTEIYGGKADISMGTVNGNTSNQQYDDNSLQVIEYWYKDDKGDIACSIQINETEVKHIPKYWKNTASSGNQSYPFVKYCKIPMQQSFWDKSEIETILDLVDAADREFLTAILNDMLNADDIIIREEDCFANGFSPSNTPGEHWIVKANKGVNIRRLGGVGSNINALNMISFIHEKIQETNGNFDSAQGKEPVRVTTASGIAQMNERANKRSDLKKADRNTGFRRLYELIDWTALEFLNHDRIVTIRGENNEPDSTMTFNSANHKVFNRKQYVAQMEKAMEQGIEVTPEMEQEFASEATYFPRIDAEIIVSDGMIKSKAFTAQATSEVLAQMDRLNPAKAEVLKSQVETMGLPNQEAIEQGIDMTIQQQQQAQMMQQQQAQMMQMQKQPAQQQQPDEAQIQQFLQQLPPEIMKTLQSMDEGERLQGIQEMMQLSPQELQQYLSSMGGK
jgi:hypothetical protein